MDPVKILGYGVIGLGFLLALLAYRLLAKEQAQKKANPLVLRAIYVFMFFSFALTAIGLGSEFIRLQYTLENTSAQKSQFEAETRSKFRNILNYIDRPILESVKACTSGAYGASTNTSDHRGCLAAASSAAGHGKDAERQIGDLKNQIHTAIGSPP